MTDILYQLYETNKLLHEATGNHVYHPNKVVVSYYIYSSKRNTYRYVRVFQSSITNNFKWYFYTDTIGFYPYTVEFLNSLNLTLESIYNMHKTDWSSYAADR